MNWEVVLAAKQTVNSCKLSKYRLHHYKKRFRASKPCESSIGMPLKTVEGKLEWLFAFGRQLPENGVGSSHEQPHHFLHAVVALILCWPRNPCLALTGDDQYSISVGAGSSRKQGIVFNSVLQPSADQDAVTCCCYDQGFWRLC